MGFFSRGIDECQEIILACTLQALLDLSALLSLVLVSLLFIPPP